ncbi:Phosphatase DCR2 [Nakaseomyces bracarensis]|uniref:Phosphatase DCR2 n=1 Tax=Nakaseomyces bracarensis TaxID=273131 RepID=A0ABR4NV45_9SACH
MSRISLRFGRRVTIRKIFFLFVVLFTVWVLQILVFPSSYAVHNPTKNKELGEQSSIDKWREASGLKSISSNDKIIVNYGTIRCFHIGTFYEACLPAHRVLPGRMHTTSTHLIKKDLRGSLYKDIFGVSEYLFYDYRQIHEFHPNTKDIDILIISDTKHSNSILPNVEFATISANKITATSLDKVVTDINILFGEDCEEPRSAWRLFKEKPVNSGRQPAYVDIKTLGSEEEENIEPVLSIKNRNGKFKIVQLADLHLGVGKNKCIDEYPKHELCEADPKSMEFVNEVIDIENPDLVVFSGDQIMGDRSREDSETTLLKALNPVIKRKIPWAMIWGNHDDEGSLTRWELSELAAKLPYSLFQFNRFDTKDNTFGVGNYAQQIFHNNTSKAAITLYFMDSHKYSKAGKLFPGYDWVKESQLEYFQALYENGLKRNINDNEYKHVSLAFLHIPLPEFANINSVKKPGSQKEIVGTYKEGVTAPKYNSGGLAVFDSLSVDVIGCGHDHCNDYCLHDDSTPTKEIWLCYGGGAGEGGYAGYGGTERRIRIYDIDTNSGTIHTWKRLNGNPTNPFDKQIIKG